MVWDLVLCLLSPFPGAPVSFLRALPRVARLPLWLPLPMQTGVQRWLRDVWAPQASQSLVLPQTDAVQIVYYFRCEIEGGLRQRWGVRQTAAQGRSAPTPVLPASSEKPGFYRLTSRVSQRRPSQSPSARLQGPDSRALGSHTQFPFRKEFS